MSLITYFILRNILLVEVYHKNNSMEIVVVKRKIIKEQGVFQLILAVHMCSVGSLSLKSQKIYVQNFISKIVKLSYTNKE